MDFPVGLPVKILKALLPSSILATCPVHFNLLDLIILTVLGERIIIIIIIIIIVFKILVLHCAEALPRLQRS